MVGAIFLLFKIRFVYLLFFQNGNKTMKEKLKISIISCSILIGVILLSAISGMITGIACPLYYLLGVPCPLCGMTRAYLAALRLDFATALSMHPLFWTLPVIMIAVFICPFFKNSDKAFKIFYIVIGTLFISVWIVRMILYFPHTEPMIFYDKSILSYALRLFGL